MGIWEWAIKTVYNSRVKSKGIERESESKETGVNDSIKS